MSQVTEILGDKEFYGEIIEGVTLVDFMASWCAPCKMQAPIIHEFNEEIKGKIKIIKVDVDQNPTLAERYGINSIPTLAVFKDGELQEKTVGLTAKAQLSEMLIKYL
ncbi:MAG: thioredoxin [Clostridiales bacterium]|nr:thioredoxin [Clostridiales bacterium]